MEELYALLLNIHAFRFDFAYADEELTALIMKRAVVICYDHPTT